MKESRIAGIATIPGREHSLHDVISRIGPQVDRIYITCNGDSYVDADHPLEGLGGNVYWAYPARSDHWSNGREDNNKFLYLSGGDPGYRFPLDDDVIHPATFVQDLIDAVEFYEREYVVSVGGKRYDITPIGSYYRNMSLSWHALHDQPVDMPVHIPLSGAMCWHTSMLEFDTEDWVYPFMADIWAGITCLKANVPVMSIAHIKGYLAHSTKMDMSDTIFAKQKNADEIQTQLINSFSWPSQ